MNGRESILKEFSKAPSGTLVMTGKLYREKFFAEMSEEAFAQAVSRLCRNGEIERVSKGIYCIPKKMRFGTILPSEREILEQFTSGGKGVVVGYGLYNELGVTTQVPKRRTVYSSITEERLKQIGNIVIKKYDLEYTSAVKNVIRMMELLHDFKKIQDVNVASVLCNLKKFSGEFNEEAFETVQREIGYPKWTIAFLREVLNYHRIPNKLGKYLSALSNYAIPKMEQLYESAREYN